MPACSIAAPPVAAGADGAAELDPEFASAVDGEVSADLDGAAPVPDGIGVVALPPGTG